MSIEAYSFGFAKDTVRDINRLTMDTIGADEAERRRLNTEKQNLLLELAGYLDSAKKAIECDLDAVVKQLK